MKQILRIKKICYTFTETICTMKYKFLLLAIAVVIFSCSKSNVKDNLEGNWLSTDSVHDTIYFYSSGMSMLNVKRNFTNNTLRMPYSGQYSYILKGDSIYPQYAVSSFMDFKYYYFKKEGDILTVGNFFAPERSHLIVKFKKISN